MPYSEKRECLNCIKSVSNKEFEKAKTESKHPWSKKRMEIIIEYYKNQLINFS